MCSLLTSLVSVTWTSSGPWKASCLCVWIAPLHSLLRVALVLGAHLFFCVILMASQSPSFVPVLRRSCLFQENSATKRVSTMAYSRRYKINFDKKTPCHLTFNFQNMFSCHTPNCGHFFDTNKSECVVSIWLQEIIKPCFGASPIFQHCACKPWGLFQRTKHNGGFSVQ